MRKLFFLVAAVFVLMAAALGWFLPLAAFSIDDRINEGKQQELDIERVNLSYRDDLTIGQKMEIVNNQFQLSDTIELDRGIFLTEVEATKIASDFLTDFTGVPYDLSADMYMSYMTPMLINLTGNRGTIVIWTADFILPDDWMFSCAIDDKTGAILKVTIQGYDAKWSALIPGIENYLDFDTEVCNRYRNAIYNQYSARLNAKFVTSHPVQDEFTGDNVFFVLIFRDGRNETFEINLDISQVYGFIETY